VFLPDCHLIRQVARAGVFCPSLPGLPRVSYLAAYDALFKQTQKGSAVFPQYALEHLSSQALPVPYSPQVCLLMTVAAGQYVLVRLFPVGRRSQSCESVFSVSSQESCEMDCRKRDHTFVPRRARSGRGLLEKTGLTVDEVLGIVWQVSMSRYGSRENSPN
jgi:hypothetical protein